MALYTGNNSTKILAQAVPNTLPLLPLVSVVVFPYHVASFSVHRKPNIELLNSLPMTDTMLCLATQRDQQRESVGGADELYQIGVSGRLIHKMNLPDGTIQVAVQGLTRVKIKKLTSLEPDESLLKTLQKDKGRICPLNCSAREVEKNGECVAKTCESGFRLNNAGECVSAPVAAKKVPAQKRASPTKRTTTTKRSGGNCFKFNGQLICD